MKKLIVIAAIVLSGSGAFAQNAAQQAEEYYLKGQAAEKAGDPTTAIAAYNAALELFPGHVKARFNLGQVKINAVAIKSAGIEAKIGAVMIPDYKLDGDTVQDAIQALALGIEKATEEKIAPNFIIEDPKGKLSDVRISLQLKNVPVKAILDYIHAQASTRARYDEHAVVIMPR
jgi:tetratricopeptide (TPR) repeat protein